VVKATKEALSTLAQLAKHVQLGVQTTGGDSARLFNRHFQSEAQVIEACKILTDYGIKIKLEVIIGLPNIDGLVPDPVTDAIKTIQMCQRICREVPPGSTWTTCFPLMLYPGTALWKKAMKAKVPLSEACEFEWHKGEGSIKFDPLTMKRIKNMSKMATMFIKYDMSERWMRALIDVNLDDSSSKQLSECQYLEGVMHRFGDKMEQKFDKILEGMNLKY
jgi:radical SAM superfamily enzyme YgiQ (UPF0313 family)